MQAKTNGSRLEPSGHTGEGMRQAQQNMAGLHKHSVWIALLIAGSGTCASLLFKMLEVNQFRLVHPEAMITPLAVMVFCVIELVRHYGCRIRVELEGLEYQTPGMLFWIDYRLVTGVYGLERASNGHWAGFELVIELSDPEVAQRRVNLRNFRNHAALLASIIDGVRAVQPAAQISADLERELPERLFGMGSSTIVDPFGLQRHDPSPLEPRNAEPFNATQERNQPAITVEGSGV
jgi:hypothetical protein